MQFDGLQFTAAQNEKIISLLRETFVEKLVTVSVRDFYLNVLPYIVLAGGAIPAMLQSGKINDFDIYFVNKEAFCLALKGYVSKVEPVKDQQGLMTAHVRTLKFGNKVKFQSKQAILFDNDVQIITRFIGQPEDLFNTFDFEHCKCYWQVDPIHENAGSVHFLGESMEAIFKKELRFKGNSRYIFSAFKRHEKFLSRGWKTSTKTRFALILAASKVDWKDPNVLSDQLYGYYGDNREEVAGLVKDILGIDINKNKNKKKAIA